MDPLYLQVFFGGLTAGSIYAMIALGFTLVYRSTTVINFAHGEFVMLGALLAISGVSTFKLPLAVAVLLASARVRSSAWSSNGSWSIRSEVSRLRADPHHTRRFVVVPRHRNGGVGQGCAAAAGLLRRSTD